MATLQIDHDCKCPVELKREEHWVRLTFSLAEPVTRGSLAALAPDADFSVEAADELAGTYQPPNWLSPVMSGTRYAFRALSIPRRRVLLSEFTGKVGSDDMGILAAAAVIAVARLTGNDTPQLDLAGWTVARAEVLAQQAENPRGRGAVA